MKKSIIKTLVLVGILLAVLSFASCKNKDKNPDDGNDGGSTGTSYKITYVLNGGTNPADAVTSYDGSKITSLPTPTREGYEFQQWYTNAEFSGEPVYVIKQGETGDKTLYAKWSQSLTGYKPKWDLNSLGFNGNGMEIIIKVLPKAEFDPFDAGYTAEDKELRKKQIGLVTKAYNIKITYSNWDNEAPWGPTRVQFIKDQYMNGEFQKKGVYIINITSQWIPTLVKANSLAELYKTESDTGPFAEVEFGGERYVQNSTVSETCAVRKVVYGYSTGAARPDYFLYYNATLAADKGMPDPAELWFKGEWTWSTFDRYVKEVQVKLDANQFAIDCGYAEFSIGAVAAQGNQMANTASGVSLIDKSHVASVFDKMRAYYQAGIWDKGHGVQDVAKNFVAGNTIFHTGSLWFLKESTRFNPQDIEFEIGMVPYPTSDTGNIMTPITEPYSYEDTEGNTVEVTEPIVTRTNQVLTTDSGEPIYGIDLSQSTYRSPFTGTGCYSIMNYENAANGINATVLFAILHDMLAGVGPDPNKITNLTADEGYRIYLERKLDQPIDIEVVMSVQSDELSYYEVHETLSMTVGNGSHFGSGENVGYWITASSIMTSQDAPATILKAVKPKYQAAMEELGY